MAPAIPSGCSLAYAESWNGESSLEGDIVAYDPQSIGAEGPTAGFGPVTDAEIGGWLVHRVVAEYESYDSSEADHWLLGDNLLAKNDPDGRTVVATNMTMAEANALEGDHVIVAKGDNRDRIDRELVPAANVRGVISEEHHVKLQDLETWPCSAVAA